MSIRQAPSSAQSLRPRFDLVDLQLFVNVAERESVTHGAHDTGLSLPAASIRIRQMEESVGSKLFVRTSRGVQLTAVGHVFNNGAEEVLRNVQTLSDGLRGVLNTNAGHIRIVANVLAATDILPDSLGTYLLAHPDVTLDLKEAMSVDIPRMVRQGQADLGVALGDLGATGDLEVFGYREFQWAIVAPGDHWLAKREHVMFVDVLDCDFVGIGASSSIFTVLNGIAAREQRELRVRASLDTFDGVCRLVTAGIGISIVPRETALRQARGTSMAVVNIDDRWARRRMRICVRPDWAMPPFARDLLDFLLDQSDAPASQKARGRA